MPKRDEKMKGEGEGEGGRERDREEGREGEMGHTTPRLWWQIVVTMG